jgi:hypothetical protein
MNKTDTKETNKEYYLLHKEEIKRRMRNYYHNNKGSIRERRKNHRRTYIHIYSESDRYRKTQLKIKILSYYGREGNAVCVNCGEDRLSCLSIDHIEGGGSKDPRRGISRYYWLKANNYPTGYQTLCMNCQWIKREVNNECHRDTKFILQEEE